MKKIILYTSVFLMLLSIYSCNKRSKTSDKENQNPKALQDHKFDLISYSRSGNYDLVEELYSELTDKLAELKRLENRYSELMKENRNLDLCYINFNEKSSGYYISAYDKAKTITDSLLKEKISGLISKSNENYANKMNEINTLREKIIQNSAVIEDQRKALKILLTLPEIEKYQKDNMLKSKEFREFTKEQNKLILLIDSLTPKF